jgi:hypothetical protein
MTRIVLAMQSALNEEGQRKSVSQMRAPIKMRVILTFFFENTCLSHLSGQLFSFPMAGVEPYYNMIGMMWRQ